MGQLWSRIVITLDLLKSSSNDVGFSIQKLGHVNTNYDYIVAVDNGCTVSTIIRLYLG